MKYLMMLVISLGLVACSGSGGSSDGGTPPANLEITTNSSLSINTGKTFVENITSNFDDHYAVVYSIDGGANSSDFTIDATDGNLSFKTAVVFNATDSLLNKYKVIIKAEANSQSATKEFVVTVKDYLDFAVVFENPPNLSPAINLAGSSRANQIIDIDTGIYIFEFAEAFPISPAIYGDNIAYVLEGTGFIALNRDADGWASRWSLPFPSESRNVAFIFGNPQDGDVLTAKMSFVITGEVASRSEYNMTFTFCSNLAGTCP